MPTEKCVCKKGQKMKIYIMGEKQEKDMENAIKY
jgi:hypothetical protein